MEQQTPTQIKDVKPRESQNAPFSYFVQDHGSISFRPKSAVGVETTPK